MLKGIANGSVVTRCPATLISFSATSPYPSRSMSRLITWGSASVWQPFKGDRTNAVQCSDKCALAHDSHEEEPPHYASGSR